MLNFCQSLKEVKNYLDRLGTLKKFREQLDWLTLCF